MNTFMKKISSSLIFSLFIIAGCSLSSIAVGDPTVSTDYILESKTRISRTVFDYSYKVNLTNNESTGITGVKATATSSSADIKITEGEVSFPDIAAGGKAQSNDTFTIRKDRNVVFDRNLIKWNVSYTPITTPQQEAKIIVGDLQGNTVNYNSIAYFTIVLDSQPTANVTIPVSSSDENEGVTNVDSVIFTPENWSESQNVTIKGRNRSVQDNLQDYRIITGSSNSIDPNYNGINPDDINIKGLSLSLQKPTLKETIFIAELEGTIKINANYNGFDRLFYSLVSSPDGMIIDNNRGVVSWVAPSSEEGKAFIVRIKVTDGKILSEIEFNVTVGSKTLLQTEVVENTITITEANNNLNGLKFRFLDNLSATPEIFTINDELSLIPLPENINKVSSYFYANEAYDKDIEVIIPIYKLPVSINHKRLDIFYLSVNEETGNSEWSSGISDYSLGGTSSEPTIVMKIGSLTGVFFIGETKSSNLNKRLYKKRNLTASNRAATLKNFTTDDVSCETKKTWELAQESPRKYEQVESYANMTCTINGLPNAQYIVLNFGDEDGLFNMWDSNVSIYEMLVWVAQSRHEFDKLGVGLIDRDVTIKLEEMDGFGFVRSNSAQEKGNVLHLNNSAALSSITMQVTVAHEYFHHAQAKTILTSAGKNIMAPNTNEEYHNRVWLSEGTATWFEDYMYDNLNDYVTFLSKGHRILEDGLTSEAHKYQNMTIWKLIAEKCSDFDKNLANLFYGEFINDPLRVENLHKVISDSSCDFGDHLGVNKNNSLGAALLYYQYATLKENKITLLDSNENDSNFKFDPTPYEYEQDDWGEVGSVKAVISPLRYIPAYGAVSLKVKKDTFTNADIDENHEAILKVKPNSGSPLIVSILSDHPSFVGNSFLDGETHRFFKTNETTEYIFSHDELIPYFITIVNPNPDTVDLDELAFEVRSKLSPELSVTSHSEGQSVNERVVTVSGNVPASASDVNRVVVSNGEIRTIVEKSSDNKFHADVVISLGDNPLIVQGYNTNDLQTPLTKEFILNLKGIESSSNTSNALISSRIVAILRWDTNETDLDFYSTDKSNETIWYQNDNITFGFLDDDDTDGYGPEVITYRSDNGSTFLNGKFDLDVHYYGGSSNTKYYIDLILNEFNSGLKRTYHYESKVTLTTPNSSQNGPSGTGSSRQNNILSINCDSQQVCGDVSIDSSYLKASTGFTQPATSNRFQAKRVNAQNQIPTAYEQCMNNYNRAFNKKGYLSWSCDSDGRKIRH